MDIGKECIMKDIKEDVNIKWLNGEVRMREMLDSDKIKRKM